MIAVKAFRQEMNLPYFNRNDSRMTPRVHEAYMVTSTDEGARIRSPWGGKPAFNSVVISDFDRPGEEALKIGLSLPFDAIGLPGVSAFANYVWGDTPEAGPAASPDEEEFNVTVDLQPQGGPFEGFWLRFRHGQNDGLGGTRTEVFRVILNYSVEF